MSRNTDQTARITLSQLGGRRFSQMTGAKNYVSGDGGLTFSIPKAKNGINKVQISLEDNDTYTVTFWKFSRKTLQLTVIEKLHNVYADMLADVFTNATGLYTKL